MKISVAKGNANGVAYLVRQGQKVVIEEDGGDRDCIILIVIPRAQSQKWLKSTPTLPVVLRVLESNGRVSQIVDGIEGKSRTADFQGR